MIDCATLGYGDHGQNACQPRPAIAQQPARMRLGRKRERVDASLCVCLPWHTVFSFSQLKGCETCTKILGKSSFLVIASCYCSPVQKLTVRDRFDIWLDLSPSCFTQYPLCFQCQGRSRLRLGGRLPAQRHLLGMGPAFREMRCKPRSVPLSGSPNPL